MGFMEGTIREQQTYWALDDMLGAESLVRVIDRFVETSD